MPAARDSRWRPASPSRAVLLVATLACAGCSLLSFGENKEVVEAQRIARLLRGGVHMVAAGVEATGKRIAAAADAISRKRLTVRYRQDTTHAARAILRYPDPHVGVIDLWILCRQYERHFTVGQGKSLFGEQQDEVVRTARASLEYVEEIVRRAIGEEAFEKARAEVDDYAERFPVREGFFRLGLSAERLGGDDTDRLAWLRSFSLSRLINPIDPLAVQIEEGAELVAAQMNEFTERLEFLPREIGWQAELLLYDLEESESLRTVTDGVATSSDALARVTQLADELPTRIREQVVAVFDDAEPSMQAAQETLQHLEQAAVGVEGMAERLTTTLEGFRATLTQLGVDATTRERDGVPQEGETNGRFDIREWDRTAKSIGAMSEEIRGALREFRGTITDRQMDRVPAVAAEAAQALVGVVWSVVGGLAVLVVVFFLARRLARR